jgi:hypothetical protein
VIYYDIWVILSTVLTGHVFCLEGSRNEVRFYVIMSVLVKIAVSWMLCAIVVAVAILGLRAS